MKRFLYLRNVATLRLDESRCSGCGMCMVVCPHGVLEPQDRMVRIAELDACMECGACAKNCPTNAITVKAGVGCAAAIVNAALGRKSSSCCCVIEEEDSGCGQSNSSSGCC